MSHDRKRSLIVDFKITANGAGQSSGVRAAITRLPVGRVQLESFAAWRGS